MWPGDTRPLWKRALEKRQNWLSAQGKPQPVNGRCMAEGWVCRRPATVMTGTQVFCLEHYINWLRATG